MSLNWDKIRIFHAVSDAKSLTKASQALNLSQSALSRQISSLEQQLGVSLFHRHARGLLLTEQGDILYNSTKEIYKKLEFVECQIKDSHNTASGPLRITAPWFLGAKWLMPHIQNFHTSYPDLRLSFVMTSRIADLSMREADVALRFFEPDQPNLIKKKLTEFKFYICASKDYLAKYGKPNTPKELKSHLLLGYPEHVNQPHQHNDWIFNIAGVNKKTHPKLLLINSMTGITELVNNNAGIACLPEFMIAEHKNIEIILHDFAPPKADLFFIYSEERRKSGRIMVFRDFMLSMVKKNYDTKTKG